MEKYLQRFLSLGRKQPRPHASVALQAVVDSVLPLVRPAARHFGVELEWQPPPVPLHVLGDTESLEQLLINLLTNALEAVSPSGAAPADVATATANTGAARRIAVHLEAAPAGTVALTVSDTGPGPAAAVQDRVFEPFVSEKPDGTGLGLPVARAIAEQHGGQIRWERRSETTCFVVELPSMPTEPKRGETAGRG
jgi:signal transduction histidine kinase